MAEGGDKNGDENPFSFKSFVKKKSKSPTEDIDDRPNNRVHNAQNLPDISARMPHEMPGTEESKSESDNPFSFKKFLKGDAKSKSGGLTTLDLAHDLPDFVQGHYGSESTQSRQPPADVQLPDFALELDNNSLLNKERNQHEDRDISLHNPIGDPLSGILGSSPHNEDKDSDNEFSVAGAIPPSAALGLPDFLSDSALNNLTGSVNNGLSFSDDDDDEECGDVSLELKRLRKENRELKKQLNEAREFSERESKRVAGVLQEMEAIQKREAEETAALENMIQQVEANLQTTTQRAVSAEKTIAKLQQDLKVSQAEATSLRSENESLRRAGGRDVMRERATYASQQLATVANSAEATLKQMLTGVENLKMVSSVLASIDKVTEPESSAGSSSSSTHSTKSQPSTTSSPTSSS